MFALYAGALGIPAIVVWSLGTSVLFNQLGDWWLARAPHLETGAAAFIVWLVVADFLGYALHRAFHSKDSGRSIALTTRPSD